MLNELVESKCNRWGGRKMKAIGYVRVSTDEQAREGVSLAAQEAKLRAYADLNDLQFIDVVVDAGKSAKNTDREGLNRVMRAVESGEAQAVIVYKLDRLSRRVVDTLLLIERIEGAGASFHSIQEKIDTKSAIGRFFLTITAAFAAMERDTIIERTTAALAHKQATGEKVGAPAFGYRVEGTGLAEVADELKAVEVMREMRAAGTSLRAIADELNARGIATKRGGVWAAATVRGILARAV
jgi:site-specific DNA recombinase